MTRLSTLGFVLFLLSVTSSLARAADLTITVSNAQARLVRCLSPYMTVLHETHARQGEAQGQGKQGTSEVRDSWPPAGKYAVASYHDENDNGQFDNNTLGIPTEGF
jgi:uncharacterized protein (DUF2141 family)